jgi:hypothetical protein
LVLVVLPSPAGQSSGTVTPVPAVKMDDVAEDAVMLVLEGEVIELWATGVVVLVAGAL